MTSVTAIIIGGGFTGTMVAVNLARGGFDGRIVLLEKAAAVGEGIAYSTRVHEHLLNVPAYGMSCYSEQPTHLADWAAGHGFAANAFVPRYLYAQYLKEQLDRFADRVEVVHEEAVSLDGNNVVTGSGTRIPGDFIVVALGNFEPQQLPVPADPGFYDSPSFERDPWAYRRPDQVEKAQTVLVIGIGLTAVDKVLELSRPGRKIYALSRHGLAPKPHPEQPAPLPPGEAVTLDASQGTPGLLRQFRQEIVRRGGDWREAVASVRAASNLIWQALPDSEKSRFNRHLRYLWDNHRHLIAASIHHRLEELQSQGLVSIVAGKLERFSLSPDGKARVAYVSGQGPSTLEADLVINCTGPSGKLSHVDSPLLKSLMDQGIARTNSAGVGLEPDSGYRVSATVFVLGPLLKGTVFETIAVPELRVQAQTVAEQIIKSPRTT